MKKLILLDSITAIDASALGAVVVSGSHGGQSSTGFAVRNPDKPALVFFNDAGRGKDDAGIFCLEALQAIGVACACYGHMSARIGDAQDGYENGIISAVNAMAFSSGLRIGMTVQQACEL